MNKKLDKYEVPMSGAVGEIQDTEVVFLPAPGSKITRAVA